MSEPRDWQLWNDDDVVSNLDDYWKAEVFVEQRRRMSQVLQQLHGLDPEARTLLDFGCGTANYRELVLDSGYEYVGADVTEKMIAAAREKFPETTFIVDDLFESRQEDESWDVVMSCDVLVHLPEFQRPFATLYRLARRHVVLKLCYLTLKDGVRSVIPARKGWMRRNEEGFIERFFHPDEVVADITTAHPGAQVHPVIYRLGHPISPYQAIFVVTKPGARPFEPTS